MKALIIEDETLIAHEMKENIRQIAPDIDILTILPSLKTANKWLMENPQPDLLFMDIRLSDGLSFELFENFTLTCPVIFCTAYEEYAIRAFKVNGVDYLLKPVQEEDLQKAISKVRQQLENKTFVPGDIQQLVQSFLNPSSTTSPYKERFIINSHNKWTPVQTKDIALIFKDNLNYMHTFNGEKLIYDVTPLDEIEVVLDPTVFFRANRQTIININAIQSVKPYGNQKLIVQLKNPLKMEIDISREKAPLFKKWMDR